MTEQEFTKFIDIIQDINETSDKFDKIGVDIYNNPIFQHAVFLYEYVLKTEYGEEGYGWVTWYLYDLPMLRSKRQQYSYANEANGDPIILNNISDLYRFLEKHYKNESNNICS